MADLDTPLSLFRKIDDGRTAFLLESVQGGEKWARFSFLGVGARAIFRAFGSRVEWVENGETETFETDGDPLEVLRDRLQAYDTAQPEDFALPRFIGGAVGMVGYDWVRFVEDIPDANPDKVGLPDAFFIVPEFVVVYDNVRHTALIVVHAEVGPDADTSAAYQEAMARIETMLDKIRAPLEVEPRRPAIHTPMEVERSMSESDFHEIVKRAKEYIEAGDIFQVVLSQQFRVPIAGRTRSRSTGSLRRDQSRAPTCIFLRMRRSRCLIGSSPEIHVRLEDGRIDLCGRSPGTRDGAATLRRRMKQLRASR